MLAVVIKATEVSQQGCGQRGKKQVPWGPLSSLYLCRKVRWAKGAVVLIMGWSSYAFTIYEVTWSKESQ